MASNITLDRPLTFDEIRELTHDGNEPLTVLVKISLNKLIVNTIEDLNDFMNDLILPAEDMVGLSDIAYAVHAAIPGDSPTIYGTGSIILRVTADANDVLDDSWEEDDDEQFWETSHE